SPEEALTHQDLADLLDFLVTDVHRAEPTSNSYSCLSGTQRLSFSSWLSLCSFRLNNPQPPNWLNRKERRERKGRAMKDLQSLCAQVRQTAYDIHLYHAHGHLEKVYENALAHRLRKAGLDVKQQYPIKVFDEDG